MNLAAQLAGARIAVGVGALLAPRTTSRLFGFPTAHDSGTARAMGRLFGVREVVLGALVLRLKDDPRVARTVFQLNACVDAGDAASMGIALVHRDGIDRAALMTLLVATGAAAAWTSLVRAEADSALA
jgi:hypothetical protein